MKTPLLPNQKWAEFKRELVTRWQELTENDLEQTQGDSRSIIDLLERKVGLAMDEASEKFSELASHYHLYDEPEEEPEDTIHHRKERVLELKPKQPAKRSDRKPNERRIP